MGELTRSFIGSKKRKTKPPKHKPKPMAYDEGEAPYSAKDGYGLGDREARLKLPKLKFLEEK